MVSIVVLRCYSDRGKHGGFFFGVTPPPYIQVQRQHNYNGGIWAPE